MKIFVCEFITGGGLCSESLPVSLAQEGSVMRDALLRDLAELAQLSIIVSYDQRLPTPVLRSSHADEAVAVGPEDDVWATWQDCIDRSDLVWIIAPETHGLLCKLSRLVLKRNKILIGSTPSAIELTSSKFATFQRLQQVGIHTIPTYRFQQWLDVCYSLAADNASAAWVAKQDDGAGAEDSAYFENAAELCNWMDSRQASHVIQPYQPGRPASISLLCKQGRAWLLSCNAQKISLQHMPALPHAYSAIDTDVFKDGREDSQHNPNRYVKAQASRFHYAGSLVNGMAQHWQAFAHIAQQVVQAFPGLQGYVGIDLIVEELESGEIANIHVLEVNPRLTTSYVGLHQAMGYNPAKLVLDLLLDSGGFDTSVDHSVDPADGGYNGDADKNSGASRTAFVMPAILRLPVEVTLNA